MKTTKALLLFLAAFAMTACSSDEPRYTDPEAHEKTVQLNEKYAPLMVGTWHYEKIGERHRYFERLTFKDDGTFTGFRKWQCRELVTIDGKEQYTDWQNAGQPTGWGDEEGPMNGTFTGTWQLRSKVRRRAKIHGLLLRCHIRLCRQDYAPFPRLLCQGRRRLGEFPARRCRSKFLKTVNHWMNKAKYLFLLIATLAFASCHGRR